LIDASIKEIEDNWIATDEPDFLWNEILSRGAFLILAPVAMITSAIDTIIGLGVAFAAICTLGMHMPTVRLANRYLDSSGKVISQPFSLLVKVINPHASFNNKIEIRTRYRTSYKPKIQSITCLFCERLFKLTKALKASEYFLVKHLFSRATYALAIPIITITKIVDMAIGCLALPFALAILGSSETINIYATDAFTITGIVSYLFQCTIAVINPWALY